MTRFLNVSRHLSALKFYPVNVFEGTVYAVASELLAFLDVEVLIFHFKKFQLHFPKFRFHFKIQISLILIM